MVSIDWEWVKNELFRHERIGVKKAVSGNAVREAAQKCLEEARTLAEPKVVEGEKDVRATKGGVIEIEGGVAFSSAKIASYIKGAAHLHLFLATLGPKIEKAASGMMRADEGLSGYLMDRIGSFAVESLAWAVENDLRSDCALKEESVSARFSPGYCDWPIEEQYSLAKVLDFSKAGVTLTKSCMMNPLKSISGMAAIGPKGLFSKTESQCVICDRKDCDYRRVLKRV